MKKSLMTGILRFKKSGPLCGYNNAIEHDLTCTQFAQFYGFTQDEVNELCIKLDIIDDNEKEKIMLWYSGYYQGETRSLYNRSNPEYFIVYCPFSIVNYLKYRTFEQYWTESGWILFFNKLFSNQNVKCNIEKLLKGSPIPVGYIKMFSEEHFKSIREITYDPTVRIKDYQKDLLLSYMFVNGYLSQVRLLVTEL
jgi:hypothetical protein